MKHRFTSRLNNRALTPIALALALGLLAGCGANDKTAEARPAETKAAAPAESDHEAGGLKLSDEEIARAGLKLEALNAAPVADTVTVTATIQPNQDRLAHIAPRVEGRIVAVSAALGASVRAGQTLAVLDSIALGEAAATLAAARAGAHIAEADFERAETLKADEIIAQKDYLRARADRDKTKAELHAAEDRLRLLGVNPAASGRVTSEFPLTAPFAGTVIERKATIGELAGPSEPLFAIADLSRVWIEANLAESMLARVRPGARATVTVAAYPGERFEGRLTYVASVLDKDSRTIPARIEVDNKDGRLKPEMFASAQIEASGSQGPREVLSVPDEAIILLQGQPTVFVAENGSFEPRAIDPGEKLGGRTVVKGGVVAGEQLVVAGAYALKARLLKSQIGDEH